MGTLNHSQVNKTYNLAGSNFQKGFKAGNFFMPNGLGPGLPVGNVHQYQIKEPKQKGEVCTYSGPGGNGQIVSLLNLATDAETRCKVVQFDSQNTGLQFDYPRELKFVLSQPFTATFNYVDRYFNKVVVVKTSVVEATDNVVKTTVAPLYLCSLIIDSDIGLGAVTGTLSTTNYFELPYTDYSDRGFLQSVTVSQQETAGAQPGPFPLLFTNPSTLSAPYNLVGDFDYIPAAWPVQVEPTLTSNYTRPLIKFNRNGTEIDLDDDIYIFTIGQTVFPTYSQKMSGLISQTQADTGVSTMGILPVSVGWTGWKG